ncbi:hypothetical protein [Taibaiella soli]|uniref:Uncharacterized protein n=1 Tax=Taibaiella soli TaxID=1649169 RepID=A0A2W2AV90_9BACT|nr:hypothetical protein [Taibaiella soli]PZF71608.1 hypothetical protein DN068_16165 [Taibaiella soli]
MKPINRTDMIAYLEFCNLQNKYKEIYTDLELRYLECGCFKCRLKLISFGLELSSLNALVNHLEEKLAPGIEDILQTLNINYNIVDGQTSI